MYLRAEVITCPLYPVFLKVTIKLPSRCGTWSHKYTAKHICRLLHGQQKEVMAVGQSEFELLQYGIDVNFEHESRDASIHGLVGFMFVNVMASTTNTAKCV